MDNSAEISTLREELALLEESEKGYHDDPELEAQETDYRRKRRFELLVRIADLEGQSSRDPNAGS